MPSGNIPAPISAISAGGGLMVQRAAADAAIDGASGRICWRQALPPGAYNCGDHPGSGSRMVTGLLWAAGLVVLDPCLWWKRPFITLLSLVAL